jgi:hypothetical protein
MFIAAQCEAIVDPQGLDVVGLSHGNPGVDVVSSVCLVKQPT